MPKPLYRVSSNMLKELRVRGAEIVIAVPAPPEETDPLAYVRRALELDPAEVVSAEYADLAVRAPAAGLPVGDTIAGRLGAIIWDAADVASAAGHLQVTHSVILATCRATTRHEAGRTVRGGRPVWPVQLVGEIAVQGPREGANPR